MAYTVSYSALTGPLMRRFLCATCGTELRPYVSISTTFTTPMSWCPNCHRGIYLEMKAYYERLPVPEAPPVENTELQEEIKQLTEENEELKRKIATYGESLPSELGSEGSSATGSGEESPTGC